jgi:phosphoglucosamine mutase
MSDFGSTGDGLVAALQVLAVLVEEGRPASEVCRRFTPLPQRLVNVRTDGRARPAAAALRDIEAEEGVRLGERGRVLIRPSGTEPVIRVMVEAEEETLLRESLDRLERAVTLLCAKA